MKSIKEKAKEGFDFPYIQDSFEEDANYVLDIIEQSLQEFSNYEDSLIISRIIQQLKK